MEYDDEATCRNHLRDTDSDRDEKQRRLDQCESCEAPPQRSEIILPKCRRGDTAQEQVEDCLLALLRNVQSGKGAKELDLQSIIEMLHRCTELLWSEPMLIELALPEKGLLVVGDLNGELLDLLLVLNENGSPAQISYVFLGNYVDGEGKYQIETFLFVLLMKLRWPNRVFMLRGNNETFEHNVEHHFFSACATTFGNESVYRDFGRLFDIMPVAAIFDDYFMFLHGGVSQWMTSRDNIRNIPRPTYINQMKMLDCCLLADILWADPDVEQKRAFKPSPRATSYTFNAKGLESALRSLRVHCLIRGHQTYMNGYCENIARMCYTVHTTPIYRTPQFSCATFLCRKERFYEVLNLRRSASPHDHIAEQCAHTEDLLRRAFLSEFCESSSQKNQCDLCVIRVPRTLSDKPRIVSHLEIVDWVQTYAKQLVLDGDLYGHFKHNPRRVADGYVQYFPVYFDIMFLNGETFRVLISKDESKIIKSYYDKGCNLNIRFGIDASTTNLDILPRSVNFITSRRDQKKIFPHLEVTSKTNVPLHQCADRMMLENNFKQRSLFQRIKNLFTCIHPAGSTKSEESEEMKFIKTPECYLYDSVFDATLDDDGSK